MDKREKQALEAAQLLKEWCEEIDEGACTSCILCGQYDAYEGDCICCAGEPFNWELPELEVSDEK